MKLYDHDFVARADEQSLLLQQQRFDELDLANLVEEVKDLGGKHRDAIESQLTRLLMHLLKWQYQPERRSGSWSGSIKEARKQIARLIRKRSFELTEIVPQYY
jgi:ribosomal protein L29